MKRALVIAAALILGFSAPVGAWAQRERPGAGQDRGSPASEPKAPSAPNKPLSEIEAQINRQYPGHRLAAKLDQQDGRTVYRISWSADPGRRIDFVVDAQTGAILSHKGG